MKTCLGLLLLVITACNNTASVTTVPEKTSSSEKDTVMTVNESLTDETDMPASFIPGYYVGTLPCSDCKSINRRMLFLPDHQFHLRDEFVGKEAVPVEIDGQWQSTNDQVQLLKNNRIIKRFSVTSKGLAELNESGTRISLSPDNYLTRKMIGADNKAWMEKKAQGIDFFALGNEPFWLMEIQKGKTISFLLVDNNQPVVFPYVAPVAQNGQWVFNAQTDSSKIQITVTRMFCSDGMSDNWYEYKVETNYNGIAYMGCGVKLNNLPD